MEFVQQKTDRATVPSLFLHVKGTIQKLCNKIEDIVGPAVFQSKDYLDEIFSHQLPNSDHDHQWTNILLAHEHGSGGFISGEVNVVLFAFLEGGRICICCHCLSPASEFQICCA